MRKCTAANVDWKLSYAAAFYHSRLHHIRDGSFCVINQSSIFGIEQS